MVQVTHNLSATCVVTVYDDHTAYMQFCYSHVFTYTLVVTPQTCEKTHATLLDNYTLLKLHT